MKSRKIIATSIAVVLPLTSMADDDSDAEEFNYPPGPLEEVVVSEFRQSSTLAPTM